MHAVTDPEDELRQFNAEAGHLSEERRERIRARVRAGLAESDPARPPRLDRTARRRLERQLDGRAGSGRWSRSLITLAAVMAVALGLGAVVVTTAPGEGDETVAASASIPPPGPSAPTGPLAVLVERAASRPAVTLGTGDRLYSHRVETVTTSGNGAEVLAFRTETWIAADGTGRIIEGTVDAPGIDPVDRLVTEPGTLTVAGVPQARLADLPRAAPALLEELGALVSVDAAEPANLSTVLLDLLADAAVPPAVRVALLEALEAGGFVVVAPTGEDDEVAIAGPGPAGSTVEARLDARSTLVAEVVVRPPEGPVVTTTFTSVDLRASLDDP